MKRIYSPFIALFLILSVGCFGGGGGGGDSYSAIEEPLLNGVEDSGDSLVEGTSDINDFLIFGQVTPNPTDGTELLDESNEVIPSSEGSDQGEGAAGKHHSPEPSTLISLWIGVVGISRLVTQKRRLRG